MAGSTDVNAKAVYSATPHHLHGCVLMPAVSHTHGRHIERARATPALAGTRCPAPLPQSCRTSREI